MVIKKLTTYFETLKSQRRKSGHRRTYIIPTRFGFYYALGIFLIAAVAYVYANNLVYMLSFFLTSMGFIIMHITNRNIDHLSAEILPIKEIFANEKTEVEVFFQDKKSKKSYFVDCVFTDQFWSARKKDFLALKERTINLKECNDQGVTITVPYISRARGWQAYTPLRMQSTFPFGLLTSWKVIKTKASELLVFPEKKGSRVLPVRSNQRGQELVGKMKEKSQDNSFQGHRPYQNRDSFRQIDWRAYARSGELLIKEFESEEKGHLVLDWSDTGHIHDFEGRISQLCLWVEICEKDNKVYKLALPQWESEMNCGEIHKTNCLTQLALMKETP